MTARRSFTTRLTLALALLLLAYGGFVAVLGRQVAAEHEQESLQRLSHGLAKHNVDHWPAITVTAPGGADRAARDAVLSMLTVVNPRVQVYVLDADGRDNAYLGAPGMVREEQVDLNPVRAFLSGAALPLRGTDPMGSGAVRIFSAAMFPPQALDTRPPGYLYVVLDGQAREQVAGQLSLRRVWQGAGLAALIGLLITMAVGAFAFRRLTRPLHRLAARLRDYSVRAADRSGATDAVPLAVAPPPVIGDEVHAIASAFDHMTQRIEAQAAREQAQANAHREMMAGVAHDLRTPLTALHGHLEVLAGRWQVDAGPREVHELHDGHVLRDVHDARAPPERVLAAALAQSDKVRHLSQQLFELAALQSSDQVLHRERFCLDELVTDAVQKFDLSDAPPPVTLHGPPPGRLEVDGDLQLIERALTNLIDNALRHAPGAAPVRVSLRRDGAQAQVLIEDEGPGLPAELLLRLQQGRSLRDPPMARTHGGIGGLGLAIAQRVAVLHGGRLLPLPSREGGTRLCLALPLA